MGGSFSTQARCSPHFVGFYDNHNRGDVSASGGVLFRDDGVPPPGFDGTLDPADAHWGTGIGCITNGRRVCTSTRNTLTDEFAIVVLVPVAACVADRSGDGVVDNGDIGLFVTLYLSGDAVADLNGDGFLDNGDLSAFVAAFLAGC